MISSQGDFDDELTGMPDAMRITSLSDKTIYRLESAGKFPKRVKIGRRTAYVKRELHQWVRDKANERTGGGI